jgi:hypothetical protein
MIVCRNGIWDIHDPRLAIPTLLRYFANTYENTTPCDLTKYICAFCRQLTHMHSTCGHSGYQSFAFDVGGG